MWRLLGEELRLYRPILLISWAFGLGIFGIVLTITALLGGAKDRAEIPTNAAHLPLALLIASMVAGFIVTGTERSESRVRMLAMLPLSIRKIAAARVLLPTTMMLLGLLVSHVAFAAMLSLRSAPFPWVRHLKVDFLGLQLLLWVLVVLTGREILELAKARAWRATVAWVAALVTITSIMVWLEVGPIENVAVEAAVIAVFDAAVAASAFVMFCRRTDFTK